MRKKENQKEVNKSLKLIVKSSIFVFIGVILSKIFALFYRSAIARYFGKEVYGLFSLAVIVLLVFVTVPSLGFSL